MSPAFLRRRAGPVLVALVVNALLVLLLIMLAPAVVRQTPADVLRYITVPLPPRQPKPPAIKPAAAPKGASLKVAPPTPPAHVIPPSPVKPLIIPGMIMLDQKTYLAADIDKMPHPSGAQVASAEGPGGGSGGQGDQPMGGRTGPHGEPLYRAKWYREPTDAETEPYLKNVRDNGWGDVMCRTVSRWHVEDCEELGDSRPGLGIARGVREASFQFLVRPPRVNGQYWSGPGCGYTSACT